MFRTLLKGLTLSTIATAAFALGSESSEPPQPTGTTTTCTDGQILDEDTASCVDADDTSFNDGDRYDAVRELAYSGAFDRAERVMTTADAPEDARFLNYRGFIARKRGHMDKAMGFYHAALDRDPDYHVARSYMGQGLVRIGDTAGAEAQLQEIARRGGKGTWAWQALQLALVGYDLDY